MDIYEELGLIQVEPDDVPIFPDEETIIIKGDNDYGELSIRL